MRDLNIKIIQPILPSECHACSWAKSEKCNGPANGAEYLLQGNYNVGCVETKKRELMFIDTFKHPSEKDRINIPTIPTLPRFIPTLKQSALKIPDDLGEYFFGITLGNITGESGNIRYKDVEKIKQSYHLPSNSKLILIGTSPDPKLEQLWKYHETKRIFNHIADMGFACVTTTTFSVWVENSTRPDQLTNQWRNLKSYEILTGLGVPTIPFLFATQDIDFDNLADWLEEHSEIDIVAVYARFFYHDTHFPHFVSYMNRIKNLVPRPLKFLVCGIGKLRNISILKNKFDCYFENSSMSSKTLHGMSCDDNLVYSKSLISIEELFKINLEKNQAACLPIVGSSNIVKSSRQSSDFNIGLIK